MIDKKGLMKNNAFHLALILVVAIVVVYVFNTFSFISALPQVNNTGNDQITVTLNISNHTSSAKGNATLGFVINEDVNYLFNFSINYTSAGSTQENLTDINVTLRGLTYLVTAAESTQVNANSFGANFSRTYTGAGEVGNGSTFNNWTRVNLTDADGYMVVIWNGTSAALGNTLVFFDTNATGGTVGLNYSKIWFNASAPTPGMYNITIRFFTNDSGSGMGNETNFTIIVNDTTAPSVVNFTYNSSDTKIRTISYANVSGSVVINVSVVDNGNFSLTLGSSAREITYVNVSVFNATGGNWNASYMASNLSSFAWNGNYWNVTINTAQFPDGTYNISIWANDSNGNFNSTNISLVTFDNTAPTASVVCSGSSGSTVHTGDVVTCTCSPSDSTSGVNSTATSITANPSTSSTGTFTETCNFADQSGNTASASDTYTVEQSPSGSSTQVPVTRSSSSSSTTSSGTTTTTPTETKSTEASHTFDSIMPGTPAVQTDVNADAGVKEISVEVNSEAQNVEITVTKHDGKPADVSVEKTGKTYTYMQIEAVNLEDKLDKATIKIQVEKQWVVDNGLTMQDVALFHYDADASVWNQLDTSFSEEDDTFYYYTADVNSFSYFAIGEKVVVESSGKTKTILGVILVLVVLAAAAWVIMNRRKK
ncbi:MAG: PGF-pre-PGF domain-containing protein [Nanoarchaeota archaeon]